MTVMVEKITRPSRQNVKEFSIEQKELIANLISVKSIIEKIIHIYMLDLFVVLSLFTLL